MLEQAVGVEAAKVRRAAEVGCRRSRRRGSHSRRLLATSRFGICGLAIKKRGWGAVGNPRVIGAIEGDEAGAGDQKNH